MCGIAGQFCIEKSASIFPNDIQNMLDIITHRGPDGEGTYISDKCSFGMKRLSIIDLEGGWQPLYNEDETLVCVCNGEIYNYVELREELLKDGHFFKSKSDVEVILHMFEKYGISFVNYLNGMFAIALYDIKNQKLYLYRDRLGKKPLFYMQEHGKLYFGSEIKSILACRDIKRKCNFKALDQIFTYNYIPTNMTSFEGVYKLMPGEYICVSTNGISISKYWELHANLTFDKEKLPEEDVMEELADLLDDAVRIRLRSDVPVGAFLSGGIDSSFVVSCASSYVKNLSTFSIGFSESEFDESYYSQKVARLLNTNHHNQIVDEKFFKLLPHTIWLNDNPHGDVSFLPSYVLSNITSKYVKTVLTGDGGDEIFGGYNKYLSFSTGVDKGMQSFFETNSVFTRDQKKLLYSGELLYSFNENDCLSNISKILDSIGIKEHDSSLDHLNLLLYLETKLLLEGNNLVKPDRMGMGNSLEARMPLLDYRVVEYVAMLPSMFKIRNGVTKYIFKKIAANRLPNEIVYRKKQMFTVPIGEWFKDSLKDISYDILLAKRTIERNLFKKEYVKKLLDDHVSGKANYTRQIRLLIIIELWHRTFIDKMSYVPNTLSELLQY